MDTIVVGVDTSRGGDEALAFALREAEAHQARLVVVLAYDYLNQPRSSSDGDFDPDFTEADALRAIDDILDRVRARVGPAGSAVEVERRPVLDLPVRALLDAGAEADLLVVGSRGLGGFTGLLLGSVSQQVATHADCPVVVTR